MTDFAALPAAVAAKAAALYALFRLVRPYCRSGCETLLASWLLLQLGLTTVMLAASAFHSLTPLTLWVSMLALICILLVAARRGSHSTAPRALIPPIAWRPIIPAILLLGLMLAGLIAHGLFFYDTTDDALNYGLTRVGLWFEQQTLFVRLPERLFEFFAWEWNADLNSLYYFLTTGTDAACSFGNIEPWIVSVLAVIFWFESFGGTMTIAWYAAAAVASMPASLALTMTIKGDIAAYTGCILGIAWLRSAIRERSNTAAIFFAISAFSFAAGSKTNCAPLAAFALLILLLILLSRHPKDVRMHLLAIAIMGVFCARHIVNLLQFGHLLASVTNQPRGVTLEHLLATLHGIGSHVLRRGLDRGNYFALFAGCGFVGSAALLFAAIYGRDLRDQLQQWTKVATFRLELLVFAGFALSFGLIAASLPWFAWSFRYYLPWLLPVVLGLFALDRIRQASRAGDERRKGIICGVLLLVAIAQVSAALRTSELTDGESLAKAFSAAQHSPALMRKLGRHTETLYRTYAEALADRPERPGKKVLILSGSFSKLFPLLGPNAQNHAEFADSSAEMVERLGKSDIDLVVITDPQRMSETAIAQCRQLGYVPFSSVEQVTFLHRVPPQTGMATGSRQSLAPDERASGS